MGWCLLDGAGACVIHCFRCGLRFDQDCLSVRLHCSMLRLEPNSNRAGCCSQTTKILVDDGSKRSATWVLPRLPGAMKSVWGIFLTRRAHVVAPKGDLFCQDQSQSIFLFASAHQQHQSTRNARLFTWAWYIHVRTIRVLVNESSTCCIDANGALITHETISIRYSSFIG